MIGIFDSGSGGLTVLKAVRACMPEADIVYFADIANVPYGDKTPAEIDALTMMGMRVLVEYGATHIINACNTVSAALTLGHIDLLGIGRDRVVEMIMPTVAGVKKDGHNRIGLVATHATVQSGIYDRRFSMCGIESRSVALPRLVPAIEGGDTDVCHLIRDDVVAATKDVTALVLGCTHFPLVQSSFEKVLSEIGRGDIKIIDPAQYVAHEALEQWGKMDGGGSVTFVVSKPSAVFQARARSLFDDSEKTCFIDLSSSKDVLTV